MNEFPSAQPGNTPYDGQIKCKLAHGLGYSVIIPDQLFLTGENVLWIQPLFFTACILARTDSNILCTIHIQISHGHQLEVRFSAQDFLRRFDDGAELYSCKIMGNPGLQEYCTGEAILEESIFLPLYHHTSEINRNSILQGSYYRASNWNVQGNKKLNNVGYVYFTCLDSIRTNDDLNQIAMSSNGSIVLLRDNGHPGIIGDLLTLHVYREKTENRTCSIRHLVEVSLLSPQHLLKHTLDEDIIPYYEIVKPFTYRIGLKTGERLQFRGDRISSWDSKIQRFDYAVIGDATTLNGLRAPFDEETTEQILKIEKPGPNSNILAFWFEHGNQDLYTTKKTNLQTFEHENEAN
ncbi:hypothetical protein [Candidatus Nitronereus thalassa]|uniref:Uncharacterized protein n=1 Tax=Candidatus Nitronereus thalassa TaxID=3020898 RepID=A0ABU3KB97_9BACT|nr:hypothetical protein [Candidatus Nitronereus thalassa]MDT7043672.1 hypothetical protein [Candidatus Nitronereus thalassa]